MKPRARLTRCCSPPEKVAGGIACSRAGMFSFSSSARAASRAACWSMPRASQDLGDDVECGNARDDAQELADIAERLVPNREDGSRIGEAMSTISPRCRTRIDRCPRGSCRTGCAAVWICRRRRGRTARRTRLRWTSRSTPDSTGRRRPPRRCRVKVFASPWVRSMTVIATALSCVQHRTDQQLRVGVAAGRPAPGRSGRSPRSGRAA